MTETPFRKFHSPLQRFMKAPLRMERLPHFRVPLPANEQVGAHTPEEYVLLSEHVIFLYSTSILGGQQMVPPPAETQSGKTACSSKRAVAQHRPHGGVLHQFQRAG